MVNSGNRNRVTWWVVGAFAVLVVGAAAFVYAGAYNVAADDPHWSATARLMGMVRERSIRARASDIVVPNLADDALIALGADHYGAMCAGCHLAPGVSDTELRAGLYPAPPNLAEAAHPAGHGHTERTPAEQFWIVKHGLKMTGMPAWGKTHDDQAIWGMVAFLRQLPQLDAARYASLVGGDAAGGGAHGQHEHGCCDEHGESIGAGDAEASTSEKTTGRPNAKAHERPVDVAVRATQHPH